MPFHQIIRSSGSGSTVKSPAGGVGGLILLTVLTLLSLAGGADAAPTPSPDVGAQFGISFENGDISRESPVTYSTLSSLDKNGEH